MTPKGKIVQVNPVLRTNTSTGRIMQEIGALAQSHGWQVWCAYSRGRDGANHPCTTPTLPVGHRFDTAVHGLTTRLFDRHGLASAAATRRFVKELEAIDPDIVHIHNIHGYFLNYPVFFDYLAHSSAKVVWTAHDTWLFTGHCYAYEYIGCQRWKHACGNCPQRGAFPRSWCVDRSRRNLQDKKRSFTSLPPERLTLVPVSQWMRSQLEQSFLAGYPMQVIHNGIDTSVLRPCGNTTVPDKKIILGVASIWSAEKGLDDFVKMASMLRPDEQIVLVGVDPKTAAKLPRQIKAIHRTADVEALARLYSAATVFVNPTWQDNYPTVNLEAMACGTPVVTYRTGGSTEAVTPATGRIVEPGDVPALLDAVRALAALDRAEVRRACRAHALANFRKEDRYADYLTLYNRLTTK